MEGLKIIDERTVLGKDFRIYGDVENPLFLAKDVAEWIDYAYKDSRKVNRDVSKMLETVDEEEKSKSTLNLGGEDCSHGGIRENIEVWFLTEDGLYEVLMQSRKPIAKAFKKEVKDILKSVRKNGGYIAGQENASPEMILANAMIVAQNVIKANEQKIAELQPKADYFDNLVDRNLLLNFTDTAKELGIKRKEFIDWLINNKYCFRSKKNDIKPYAAYSNTATENTKYFEVKEWANDTHSGIQTLITPRGREVFRLLMIG